MPDTPTWALRLVAAVEQYEGQHGHPTDGWTCLRAPLLGVPELVRHQAEGYAAARREAEREAEPA